MRPQARQPLCPATRWRVVAAALLAALAPSGSRVIAAPAASSTPPHSRPACLRIDLTGEAAEGQEWKANIGNGWVFRVVPVSAEKNSAPDAVNRPAHYSGWDLVVSPEADHAYPDALLLATPPYGSINQREIATTFGLRAQDAIAWTPRRFHFFTVAADLSRARTLYRTLMDSNADPAASRQASLQLLTLLTSSSSVAAGEISILDAHLIPGTADPLVFARQWAAALPNVPHTFLPDGGNPTQRGELRFIRFQTALWLPASWPLPPALHAQSAKCAE